MTDPTTTLERNGQPMPKSIIKDHKFAMIKTADPKSAALVAPDRTEGQSDLAAWTMVASTLLNLDEAISKQCGSATSNSTPKRVSSI